jgi:hypothetical protein
MYFAIHRLKYVIHSDNSASMAFIASQIPTTLDDAAESPRQHLFAIWIAVANSSD